MNCNVQTLSLPLNLHVLPLLNGLVAEQSQEVTLVAGMFSLSSSGSCHAILLWQAEIPAVQQPPNLFSLPCCHHSSALVSFNGLISFYDWHPTLCDHQYANAG